jgi:hypothetical protein
MMTSNRLVPWALIAAILAFAVVVRIRLLDTPLERDEGEYAYAGQLLLQRIPPYQQSFNMKFPGTYGAYALIMAVFGQTIQGIHLGFLIVNAATIVLIFLLGRRLLTPTAGVAASAAYALLSVGEGVMGTQAHATHFVMLAAIGGTLLLQRAVDTGGGMDIALSGLLYGIAVLMKQHAVLFVAFGVSYLIWARLSRGRREALRNAALFLGGAFAPLALTGAALWRAGVFQRFWFWTVTYAREYVLERTVSNGIARLEFIFPVVVGPNLAIWIAALVGLVAIWIRRERNTAVFLTAFLAFSFLSACPGYYFRQHYFVLILPAIALLAGAAVSSASEKLPGAVLLVWAICGVALFFCVEQQQDFLFRSSPLEVSRAMYGDSPFPEAIQIGDYIRNHSAPGSRIAVLGSEPEIPFYADRHSATGHIYMYGLMEAQPYALTMQEEFTREVESARPEYVVVVSSVGSWLKRPDSPTRIFTWWAAYGPEHYKIAGIGEIFQERAPNIQWGNVMDRPTQSPSAVRIYRRADL